MVLSMRSTVIVFVITIFYAVIGITNSTFAEEDFPASMLHLKCIGRWTGADYLDPIFQNVDEIVIVTSSEVVEREDDETQSELLDIINPSYVSKVATELYSLRFKDIGVEDDTERGCYSRHNQPIKILPFITQNDRIIARKLSQVQETLTVYLRISQVRPNSVDLYVVNYRPNLSTPFLFRLFGYKQPFWEAEGKLERIQLEGKDKKTLERDLKIAIARNIN